jgi:hypothetical protein
LIASIRAVRLLALCTAAIPLFLGPQAFSLGSRKMPRVAMAHVPQVGDSISAPHTSFSCVVNSAQTYPCFEAIVDGITFQVAFTGDGPLFRVADVRTIDLRFISPEGLKIDDVIPISSRDDLILAPNYAVYANRGKVWIPIIGFLDNVFVLDANGKQENVPIKEIHFDSGEIRVRITGFVQWKGVNR